MKLSTVYAPPARGLILLSLLCPALSANAESFGQQNGVTYSPDRWPSRWSSVVETEPTPAGRRRSASRVDGSYYVDSFGQIPPRYERERSAPVRDHLFEIPSESRPWGELPRSTRRSYRSYDRHYRPCYEQRGTASYSPSTPPGYAAGGYLHPYSYPAYPYAGNVYGAGGYGLGGWGNPYAGGGLPGPAWGYPGVTPGLGMYPGYPIYGAPYGGYPSGLTGMNWPFGAW